MARLVSPPTFSRATRTPVNPVVRQTKPRCAPSKSVTSKTTSRATPATSRPLHPARNVLPTTSKRNQKTSNEVLRSGTTIHKVELRNRKTYKSSKQTRIPRPPPPTNIRLHKLFKPRRHYTFVDWTLVTSFLMMLKPKQKKQDTQPQVTQVEGGLHDDSEMSFASDNNPDLLQDQSFDENINQEPDALAWMRQWSRKIAAEKNIRRAAPIAKCPRYIGDNLNKPRVRKQSPAAMPLILQMLQSESKKEAAEVAIEPSHEQQASPTAAVIPLSKPRGPRCPRSSAASESKVKPLNPSGTLPAAKKRLSRARIPDAKLSTTKPTKPVMSRPVQKPRLTSRRRSAGIHRPRPNAKKVCLPLKSCLKATQNQKVASSGTSPAAKHTSSHSSDALPSPKAVQFIEGPIQPRFYNLRSLPKNLLREPQDCAAWILPERKNEYSDSIQSHGFDKIFAATSPKAITLKRRVLLRFAAVQRYEKHRREEALAKGEQPSLGQLEYGNADYKIALQPTKIITAYDIGIIKHPTVDDSLVGNYNQGPLLCFGRFQDPLGREFEEVEIPESTAAM